MIDRPGGLSLSKLTDLISRVDLDPVRLYAEHVKGRHLLSHETITEDDVVRGEQAINAGEVAIALIARSEIELQAIPMLGMSLISWKLMHCAAIPVWILCPPELTQRLHQHLTTTALPVGLDGRLLEHFVGIKLTTHDEVKRDASGRLSLYPLGTGDLGPVLQENDVFEQFPNVKYVYVLAVDDALSTLHPGILGLHIFNKSKVTYEAVGRVGTTRPPKNPLAWVGASMQVVDVARVNEDFLQDLVFEATDSCIIDADLLKAKKNWRWNRESRDGSVCYTRSLHQYTENNNALYVEVPCGERHHPVRCQADMDQCGTTLNQYRFR